MILLFFISIFILFITSFIDFKLSSLTLLLVANLLFT